MTDRVTLSTEREGLFGPGRVPAAPPPVEVIFSEYNMPDEGTPELERFGEIYEDVPTDLPLGVVQEAWDRAMSECRRERVFAIQRCENVVVRPSQQVCETASSINVPSSVRLECCVFGGTYPNDCAFPGTKATFTVDPGDYGAPDSYTPNLPGGLFDRLPLDARPTQTISRPFDAGAEVSALIQYEAGLDLTLDADPGSVDVTYTTDIMLEATAASAVPGDIVTVTGRQVPDPTGTFMESEYPNIEMLVRYFFGVNLEVEGEIAHMDAEGQQHRDMETLYRLSTSDLDGADADGRLYGEAFRLQIGLGGAEVSAFADKPGILYDLDGFPAGAEVTFEFPLAFSWDITKPFTCPTAGIPLLGGWTCPISPIVSTDLFELGISTPAVDTPVQGDYDGGYADRQNTEPLVVRRNHIDDAGVLVNTSPTGFRELYSSLFDALGTNDLNDLLTDDGKLGSDFLRIDMDLDGVASAVIAPTPPGAPPANPFGGNVSFGKPIPDPATNESTKPAKLEFNFLDVDFVNWFSVDQRLSFDPGLVADLRFSQPVLVRESDTGEFSDPVTTWPMSLGTTPRQLQFVMPAGDLTITPTYSPRNNRFTNATDIVWTGALQESVMQAKLQGILFSLLSGALGIEEPSIALFQATQATDPLPVGQFGGTPYAMEGLTGLQFPGTPLRVAAIVEPPRPEPRLCDLDTDGDIDRDDILVVRSLNQHTVPPADPAADADGNGSIEWRDISLCLRQCTRARCQQD